MWMPLTSSTRQTLKHAAGLWRGVRVGHGQSFTLVGYGMYQIAGAQYHKMRRSTPPLETDDVSNLTA